MTALLILAAVPLALVALLFAHPRTRKLAQRLARTGKLIARDKALPRWARFGLLAAALPVPGPFDEIVGAVIAGALLRSRHRGRIVAAWQSTS
jgi:hypothetical protein